ncbi:MAG TPA: isochorismatase family cysteine hydrolase [Polyangiaceae bacterium]|jgi:nicotinamidase-related amidase|nr:isochorismatase family cysteine hydrolase [Polyangiaceae bacterium]
MTDEELADLIEVALARRPDRVAQVALGLLAPAQRKRVVELQEQLAQVAHAVSGESAPPATLRERILATVRASRKTRKALVVVDMINDHLTPGRILEVPRARDIVPAMIARLEEARQSGTPIVYVLDQHDPTDSDLDDWGEHAVVGTEGAQVWPPLAPHEGDRIVTKPSYSSFYRSDLEKVLGDLGVDTIELMGCSTEVQLLSTATDALQLGFAVEVPDALQAGTSADAETLAMKTMQFLVPYKPSRDARLAKLAQLHATV